MRARDLKAAAVYAAMHQIRLCPVRPAKTHKLGGEWLTGHFLSNSRGVFSTCVRAARAMQSISM
jgi:hypothetical protein